VLSNEVDEKKIYLLGHFKSKDKSVKGILKLEKQPFEELDLVSLGKDVSPILNEMYYFQNDIYGKYFLQMNEVISKI